MANILNDRKAMLMVEGRTLSCLVRTRIHERKLVQEEIICRDKQLGDLGHPRYAQQGV